MSASAQYDGQRYQDGHRLYLHEQSLRELARDPALEPRELARALTSASAMRIAGHHLGGGVTLGVLPAEIAADAEADLSRALYAPLTSVFRRTLGPELSRSEQSLSVLLLPDESVGASCFVSGYWTFATTPAAADRMFSDDAPLQELYRQRAAGGGPSDLRVIRGRRLVIDVAGVTEIGLQRHFRKLAQRPVQDHRVWRALCHEVSEEFSVQARKLLVAHLDTTDVGQARLMDDICEAICRKYAPFEKGEASSTGQDIQASPR
jgi:hypothetical protein